MKILQVVHSFYPVITGGVENHALGLSRELVRMGHDVTVITSSEKGASAREVIDGIKVKRLWSFGLLGFSSVRVSPMLLLEMLRTDADVVHSHGYATVHSFIAAIGAFLKGKPYVFTLHGYHRFGGGLGGVIQSVYKTFFSPILFGLARRVISVTSATLAEDLVREIVKENITIIPNGVDTSLVKKNDGGRVKKMFGKARLVTYVGRLDKYKGVDVLLEAFASVKDKFPETELLIAGKDDGAKQELISKAKTLGISERVHFEEFGPADIPSVYSASDLVVLPSFYEGLPLVMLEALACETLYLSTRVGAAEEVLYEAYGKASEQFLAKPKDPKELADKMTAILSKAGTFSALRKQGREFIEENYSWTMVAKRVAQIYDSVIQPARSENKPQSTKSI